MLWKAAANVMMSFIDLQTMKKFSRTKKEKRMLEESIRAKHAKSN